MKSKLLKEKNNDIKKIKKKFAFDMQQTRFKQEMRNPNSLEY